MKEFLAFSCCPVRGMRAWLALMLTLLLGLTGCSTAPPDGITVVSPFDVNRYAGKWYEIARMDHSFERGLSEVSATYRLAARRQRAGRQPRIRHGPQDWKEAVGKAVFTGDANRGSL
jgi:apolipoprotein D and lipocalin family protein